MAEMICRGCHKKIIQVCYIEKAILEVSDGQIHNGSGIIDVVHNCGHQLSEDQVLALGLLD